MVTLWYTWYGFVNGTCLFIEVTGLTIAYKKLSRAFKMYFNQEQLEVEKKNLRLLNGMFVASYAFSGAVFFFFGHYWRIFCPMWIRWFLWDIIIIATDLPALIAILILHRRNFTQQQEEVTRDSTQTRKRWF
jgi:hypothetical protein